MLWAREALAPFISSKRRNAVSFAGGAVMAVHLDFEAQVATITIDRPQVRNAIDQATAHEISVSLGKADADPDARVIVITGAGGSFCVGMDLEAFLRGEVVRSPTNGFAGVTQRMLKKPLIAAVE